jgi:hypothetical protein
MKLIPTAEQVALIQEGVKGSNLCVRAFAGSSKTTSCIMLAEAIAKPSLYIAFMKNNAEEAKGKFPSHVDCMTVNSLAWRSIIKYQKSPMGKKLSPFFSFDDMEDAYPNDEEASAELKFEAVQCIKEFCQSAFVSVHNYFIVTNNPEEPYSQELITYTMKLWENLINENDPIKITHDVYLKLFQLSKPYLRQYKVIYLDEAQDSSPVILDIVMNQLQYDTQVILVGDS